MSALRSFLTDVFGAGTKVAPDVSEDAEGATVVTAATQAGAAAALEVAQGLPDGSSDQPAGQAVPTANRQDLQTATNDDLLLEFVVRIVLVNRTDVVLTKFSDEPVQGRYLIKPPPSVPARQTSIYTIADKRQVSGTAVYIPAGGGPGAKWNLSFTISSKPGQQRKVTSSADLQNDLRFTHKETESEPDMRFILENNGPAPVPQTFISRVVFNNDTDVLLRKSSDKLQLGNPETGAPTTIPPRQSVEFEVRSEGALADLDQQFISGALTWTPDGQQGQEVWSVQFTASAGIDSSATSTIPSDRFIADKPQIVKKDFRFNLRDKGTPPPPGPDSFVSRVIIDNDTDAVLQLISDPLTAGVFEAAPKFPVPPRTKMEFTVRSEQKDGAPSESVAGSLRLLPQGAAPGEVWVITYAESPKNKRNSTSTITSASFIAKDPDDGGRGFQFKLQVNPQKPPPPPPPGQGFVSQVFVKNNTAVVLNNVPDTPAIGTFAPAPPQSIAAGVTEKFALQSDTNPNDGTNAIAAAVVWKPSGGDPSETWTISVSGTDQDGVGRAQQQLISTRFSADNPVVDGNDFTFALNDEPEPEFKPPVAEKQPTLRLNDKSADGWVEYLQERLNERLTPSRNLKVDGTYGPITQQAVFAYQNQEGLQKDGTVGNETWASLRQGAREAVGTDGRVPHTFVEQGIKARWTSEAPETYSTSNDRMELEAVSVGTDTDLEGQKVSVFVTPPGAPRKGVFVKIGPRIRKSQTGQGDVHLVAIENLKQRFPSVPKDQDIALYVVEAFFDQTLGGDFYSSTKRGVVVKP